MDLVAGASTEINVRVSRLLGESVTVDIVATTGLSVASSVLLTNLNEVVVSVTATESYAGTATVTFTADDYATARVTVNITDATPQPIELAVRSSTELDLVTFETAGITVSVAVAATLNVVTEGSVRLEGGRMAGTFGLGAGETQIQIEAVSVGEGTVTFTVGEGGTADTAVVTVMVIKPTLMISASGVDELEIEARKTTDLTVTVNVEAGNPTDVTLTATVSGEAGRVVSVNPTERVIERVSVDTLAMFTVEGLDAGTATLRLTASHPDYKSTSIDVSVSVYLPGVELSVSPPSLRFDQEATRVLMVEVGASTEATITISSSPSSIVSVLSQPFTLMGGPSNNSTDDCSERDEYRQDDY